MGVRGPREPRQLPCRRRRSRPRLSRTKGGSRSRTTSSLAKSGCWARAKESTKGTRYYKAVGLGTKTPRTAIDGTYVDKKCPWTGNVNIRGKLITGVIKTTKMKNTIIIRKDYLHYIKKYNRFEKRHKNTPVHVSPAFRVKQGDEILAGQCRPLSKTVRFNMLKIIRSMGGDKKGFAGM